ncbi:hypothetical protein ADL26_15235, partial [Thermoactinomyces vulgaris]
MAGVAQCGLYEAGLGGEVAQEGTGLGAGQGFRGHLAEHVGDESGHGAPAAVDGGLADAGAAGDLGEKRPTDPAATSGMSDGHRQDERLLAGMRLPAFVVPEVAVELELSDPDDRVAEFGHDDVQALG